MALVELAGAYLHIPIDPAHYCFLRFSVKGAHFRFCCLPFGLCSAPRTFSNMLSATIVSLRLKDIQIFHYLNDILLLAPSSNILHKNVFPAFKGLNRFGWMINLQKS